MVGGDPDAAGVGTAREHSLRDSVDLAAPHAVGVIAIRKDGGDAAHVRGV